MELNDALKETISKYGIEIIRNKQYVNILDDLGSFRNESTPLKKIMKGLLDSGFSDLLCQHHQINDIAWYYEVEKCVSDYKISKSISSF